MPDQNSFNYGRGWGSDSKPPLYLAAMKKSRELNEIAQRTAHEAWELEHALWVVRIATTGEEKAIALAYLAQKMRKYHNQSEAA